MGRKKRLLKNKLVEELRRGFQGRCFSLREAERKIGRQNNLARFLETLPRKEGYLTNNYRLTFYAFDPKDLDAVRDDFPPYEEKLRALGLFTKADAERALKWGRAALLRLFAEKKFPQKTGYLRGKKAETYYAFDPKELDAVQEVAARVRAFYQIQGPFTLAAANRRGFSKAFAKKLCATLPSKYGTLDGITTARYYANDPKDLDAVQEDDELPGRSEFRARLRARFWDRAFAISETGENDESIRRAPYLTNRRVVVPIGDGWRCVRYYAFRRSKKGMADLESRLSEEELRGRTMADLRRDPRVDVQLIQRIRGCGTAVAKLYYEDDEFVLFPDAGVSRDPFKDPTFETRALETIRNKFSGRLFSIDEVELELGCATRFVRLLLAKARCVRKRDGQSSAYRYALPDDSILLDAFSEYNPLGDGEIEMQLQLFDEELARYEEIVEMRKKGYYLDYRTEKFIKQTSKNCKFYNCENWEAH